MRKHSGMSLYLRSTKKLEPTEPRCSHYQPRVKASHLAGDELPMGYKPGEKGGRENPEIRTAPLGIEAEGPRI